MADFREVLAAADRHRQPVWFWDAMVACLAAAGWILYFALAV